MENLNRHNVLRAATGVLLTNRPISREFRDDLVEYLALLDMAITEIEMHETAARETGGPFYSKALEMADEKNLRGNKNDPD